MLSPTGARPQTKVFLAGPSRAVVCSSMSKIACHQALYPFDTAKLGTKKMRSNLLERIQKLKTESLWKSRKFSPHSFCPTETTAVTFSKNSFKTPRNDARLKCVCTTQGTCPHESYAYKCCWKSLNVCLAIGTPPRALMPSGTEPNFSSSSVLSLSIRSSSTPDLT